MILQEPNVGGSEMASREKKPLAPSKSKQKASNDSGLPSNEIKNKKGKSLPNIKQQQLTQETFDTVATGSQVPVKLETNLPRRNALKNLKRKQNLRAAKANLIKSKVTKKVTNKNIHRIAPDVKKGVKTKRVKQSEESTVDISSKSSENQTNNKDNEGKGTETPSKSAKNNLRTKKIKSDIQNKEEASATSSIKVSPKLGRKGKTAESPDSLSKSAKTTKSTNLKKSNTKDNFIKVEDNRDLHKGAKSRKSSGKESDCGSVKSNSSIEKFPKAILDDKNSIDLTIDEVIASSMLSDSETENESVTEKTEGKVTRSKKMLVDENIICDIEIKKEPDTDDMKVTSDGEYTEMDQGFHFQNAIQLRKRSKVGYIEQVSQRSLRNGKHRQLSDSGNSADNDSKKRHRLNSDGTTISDNLIEHISDCSTNMDSCFSDPSCNESQTASSKEEICLKDEVSKSFDEETDIGSEMENNNNSDRVDRTGETGPTLRSKTKAKTIENEATKDDDVKIEDTRITPKCAEAQEDSKKLNNLDQARKDNMLAKLTDKSKSRRSSLNIDMKKTVNSFYSTDKSDGNSKSQIDQMIENIKLNIAKSIESKIFGPEKGLGLSKSFDVPKIEEIVAPLSTESQKMGLEDNTDEDGSAVTKNEITSDSSENSVPKVADTAKEIEEKLVKSDIGEAEMHSQNIQENRASDSDRINNVHNICESTCNISNNSTASCNSMDESEVESVGCSTASSTSVNFGDNESKILDENKKIATRKSSRISDKSLDVNSDARKSNRTPSKAISRLEDVSAEHVQKPTNEDIISEDAASHQLSDDSATTVLVPASPRQVEERFVEKHAEAKELETSLSNSEESETLESISREVERLVAGDQSAKSSLPNATNDTSLSKEIIFDTMISDKERVNKEEASACCNDNISLESAANTTNEIPSESHGDSNLADANDTLQENDASCKTAQSAKHFKTNNVSTTANCDSNSECSSVNSVPVRMCTPISWQNDETKKLDPDNDCKELGKISDSISNLDENISKQNSESNKTDPSNKSPDNKNSEEQKPMNEKKRALRARDKQKKQQSASRGREYIDGVKVKAEEAGVQKTQNSVLQSDTDKTPQDLSVLDGTVVSEDSSFQKIEDTGDSPNSNESDDILESQSRTRRRDIKRRKEESSLSSSSKTKRVKRESRKSDQQNKEETLLDNEVAKINENNRSFLNKYASAEISPRTGRAIREFFKEYKQATLDKEGSNVRSKSENDLTIVGAKSCKSGQLSRNLSENHVLKQTADNIDILENEYKSPKIPNLVQKDSDESSTSGESSNSDMPKILETPEDKERKESILRTLGLESLEEAAKRMQNQQKIKKEQSSGTLKTVIKVSQKEKDKDKRGSRSPLKMILKQQGRGDGEGDSPEFYTIQKEVRDDFAF